MGTRSARVLIVECVPKGDGMREGMVLREFLQMGDMDRLSLLPLSNKSDLIDLLDDGAYLQGYDYVHLSGHGKAVGVDAPCFQLPRGRMFSYEFPEGCFEGKVVALSACELGRRGFAREFKEQTGAEVLVAPQREILFVDASAWFVSYYYFLLVHGMTALTAFRRTQTLLKPRLKGAFQYL